jgi:outer membrane protein assembly factor BamB
MEAMAIIYCGVKSHLLAVDDTTGALVWSTRLVTGIWAANGLVNVLVGETVITVHTAGRLFGLDKGDGRLLWENPLTGYGYGFATLVSGRNGAGDGHAAAAAVLAAQRRTQQQQAS